jgi:diguanylate cyclase (GGDEF)-like protein/PAS domain S-box-containing protein
VTASGAFARLGRSVRAAPPRAYGQSVLLAASVACLAALPLALARATGGEAAFCLANALLLVVILRAPPESRGAFLVAGFFGNAVARLATGDATPSGFGLAFCDSVEVATAVALIRWRRGASGSGRGNGKLAEITLLAAVVAPALAATLAAALSRGSDTRLFAAAWLAWYARDALGMAVIVPFGIALEYRATLALFRREALAQTLLTLGILFCVLYFVFELTTFPRIFLVFPVFVFVAFRLGVAGAALATLLTAIVAFAATFSGHGPLAFCHAAAPLEQLYDLQSFLTISAWTMLPIVAVMRDREALLAQLHERWSALSDSHDELERSNARIGGLIALQEAITAGLPSRQNVIDVILSYAQQQTSALGAVMQRVEGDVLVYEVATGALAGAVGARVARGASLSGLCSTSNEVLYCSDVEKDSRVDVAACNRLGIRSMIVVPLASDGVVSGVLKVASDRRDAFGTLDILNLRLAARQLASAMRAASSYGRMELAEAEAQATIENLAEAVVVFDGEGTVLRHNAAAERVLGLSKQQVEAWASEEPVFAVDVDENELSYEERPVRRSLRTGVPERDVVVGVGRLGVDRRWISMTVTLVAGSRGPQVERCILSARDVTQLQRSELEQREYARQLSSLHLIASQVTKSGKEQIEAALALCREELDLDWAYIGVIDDARAELVIESSVGSDGESGPQAVGARLSLDRTLIGRVLASRDVLAIADLAPLLENEPSVVVNGSWGAYIAVPIWVADRVYGAIGFTSHRARPNGFLASERDFVRITGDLIASAIERRVQRERLDALAHSDALTGLPNRLVFEDRLARTLLAAKRYEEAFAVLYVDLDGFKGINDTYGHGAGDEVLRTVARRLEAVVRESDTVARIGGDEFLILAPKVRTWSDASDLAWRVVEAMRVPIAINGSLRTMSASVGASVYPEDAGDAEMMVRRADAALYRAKSTGKDSVGFARELALTP